MSLFFYKDQEDWLSLKALCYSFFSVNQDLRLRIGYSLCESSDLTLQLKSGFHLKLTLGLFGPNKVVFGCSRCSVHIVGGSLSWAMIVGNNHKPSKPCTNVLHNPVCIKRLVNAIPEGHQNSISIWPIELGVKQKGFIVVGLAIIVGIVRAETGN